MDERSEGRDGLNGFYCLITDVRVHNGDRIRTGDPDEHKGVMKTAGQDGHQFKENTVYL